MLCWKSEWDSVIGRMAVLCSADGVMRIALPGQTLALPAQAELQEGEPPFPVQGRMQAWLAGERRGFDLPVDIEGTPFQQRVWWALRSIPYGETVTYAQLAMRVGHPTAIRAVGTALGANPVPILLPCHRVWPASGKAGGFAGGTELKVWLTEHERKFAETAR